MTRQEAILGHVMEECDEVSQRVSKMMRFGPSQVQPGQHHNNYDRVVLEFNDLCAVLEMAGFAPAAMIDRRLVEDKIAKVEKYLAYSAMLGIVRNDDGSLITEGLDRLADGIDETRQGMQRKD